ncbi:MAG: low molecular weight phosphotyrosine protein phosphatase [Acidimicrobiia bacterium]|nr:low molecular weight phosphotyrosine protein phosphatase [Acidimicrobiia bacterium]
MRVLTVCLGNICRSPTAAAAIEEAARLVGVAIEVESAGTGAWNVGSAPDPRMIEAARREGLEVQGTARRVSADDFEAFDLILAMDRVNFDDLIAMAPDEQATRKVRMFREFDSWASGGDVPDPYNGGTAGFVNVVRMARDAAEGLAVAIRDGSLVAPKGPTRTE